MLRTIYYHKKKIEPDRSSTLAGWATMSDAWLAGFYNILRFSVGTFILPMNTSKRGQLVCGRNNLPTLKHKNFLEKLLFGQINLSRRVNRNRYSSPACSITNSRAVPNKSLLSTRGLETRIASCFEDSSKFTESIGTLSCFFIN